MKALHPVAPVSSAKADVAKHIEPRNPLVDVFHVALRDRALPSKRCVENFAGANFDASQAVLSGSIVGFLRQPHIIGFKKHGHIGIDNRAWSSPTVLDVPIYSRWAGFYNNVCNTRDTVESVNDIFLLLSDVFYNCRERPSIFYNHAAAENFRHYRLIFARQHLAICRARIKEGDHRCHPQIRSPMGNGMSLSKMCCVRVGGRKTNSR